MQEKILEETMILHGANNYIVKGPFIIEGILQGLIGSIISKILLYDNHFIIIRLFTRF